MYMYIFFRFRLIIVSSSVCTELQFMSISHLSVVDTTFVNLKRRICQLTISLLQMTFLCAWSWFVYLLYVVNAFLYCLRVFLFCFFSKWFFNKRTNQRSVFDATATNRKINGKKKLLKYVWFCSLFLSCLSPDLHLLYCVETFLSLVYIYYAFRIFQ